MEGTAAVIEQKLATKKGDVSPVSMSVNDFNTSSNNGDGGDGGGGETAEQKVAREAAAAAGGGNETPEQKAAREALANETPEQKAVREALALSNGTLTEAQIIEGLKKAGIEVTGTLAEMKEKFTKPTAQVELNDEQKRQLAEEKDKKLLQLYMANGGSAEQYVAMKNLLQSKPEEISVTQIRKELKDAGFEDAEINNIINERYYQDDPEKLERLVEESDEDFETRKDTLVKKAAFGKTKIESRGKSFIKQAESFFTGLAEALSIEESLVAKESTFSSKVDEMISKVDKKVKIELGKVNDLEISPIEFEISDEDKVEVAGILKDKEKRNQYFNNKDNELNLENVVTLMLRNKYLEKAVKVGFLSGRENQVAEFRKVFPGMNAHDVGLGGVASRQGSNTGKAAKAGKAQPMSVTLK